MLSRWVEQELFSPPSTTQLTHSQVLENSRASPQLLASLVQINGMFYFLRISQTMSTSDITWSSSRRRTSYNHVLGCSIAAVDGSEWKTSLKSPPLRSGRTCRLLWVLIFAVLLRCCCWLSSVDDE